LLGITLHTFIGRGFAVTLTKGIWSSADAAEAVTRPRAANRLQAADAGASATAPPAATTRRTHAQLAARLRPALPGLDDQELAFRVFCVGGIVNRFHTAASLPESAAASAPDLERLLVAAVTGMLAGAPAPFRPAPRPGTAARS
jgi:hypothetical protein